LIKTSPTDTARQNEFSFAIEQRQPAPQKRHTLLNNCEQLLSGPETVLRFCYEALVENVVNGSHFRVIGKLRGDIESWVLIVLTGEPETPNGLA
jgi:hypothetical protein